MSFLIEDTISYNFDEASILIGRETMCESVVWLVYWLTGLSEAC